MGKVNWIEAEKYYMSGTHVSYSMVAQKYGVSKSTAQSYGTRHGWKGVRQAIFDRKIEILIEDRAKELADIENDHLKMARYIQSSAIKSMNTINKQLKDGDTRKYLTGDLVSSIRAMVAGMDLEASILGLKRHRIHQIVTVDDNYGKPDEPAIIAPVSHSIDKAIELAEKRLDYLRRKKAIIDNSTRRGR